MTIDRFLAYEPKPVGPRGRATALIKQLHATLQSLEVAISIAPKGNGRDLMEEAHK